MGRPIHLGLAAMAGFPMLAVIDMSLHGGHNLLPLEFAVYAVYGVFGVIAATAASALRRLIARSP
jgi:peptidoglycan/LPS O-acetylase OafA/YrhL